MCGIAGFVAVSQSSSTPFPDLRDMISMLAHRGPEAAGTFQDTVAGLAHARLSIIDLDGGIQPIPNEDGTIWVICNGELYNYLELRRRLVEHGHRFRTQSDTEVLVHLYEELGAGCASQLNGEFAFAIWDAKRRRLLLGRDRFGVRPLFYALGPDYLLFASEVKAIFAANVDRRIDPRACAQIFTTWSPLPGATAFAGVRQVLPGYVLQVQAGSPAIEEMRYWRLQFPPSPVWSGRPDQEYAQEVRRTLQDAVSLRLRADVRVAAYLSGGLDSTAIVALAQQTYSEQLHTYSVAFTDAEFDERNYAEHASRVLGTAHRVIECDAEMIRKALLEVVWHAEVPLLRLAPVPMYLLSNLVRQDGVKVVLTGEGADELFGGYDIFKEALIRGFWAEQPDSHIRYHLFRRIYQHVPEIRDVPPAMLKHAFAFALSDTSSPYYSHAVRWHNAYTKLSRVLSASTRHELADYQAADDIRGMLPDELNTWEPLARAQFVEIVTFLSNYLLSSQGDRMMMAHSVEGRYPFLDHQLVEMSSQLPSRLKLRGLSGEKYILRLAMAGLVPDEILRRPKHPYRAPIQSAFAGRPLPDYAQYVLSPARITAGGMFDPTAVAILRGKLDREQRLSENDEMAFAAILTYQLLHELFIANWAEHRSLRTRPVTIVDVAASAQQPAV